VRSFNRSMFERMRLRSKEPELPGGREVPKEDKSVVRSSNPSMFERMRLRPKEPELPGAADFPTALL
jgi:hypothetical protein